MRVRPEQVFTIVDKESKVAQAKVISCTSDTVQLKLLQYIEDADTEAPIEVALHNVCLKAIKWNLSCKSGGIRSIKCCSCS